MAVSLEQIKAFRQKAVKCRTPEQFFGELAGDTTAKSLESLKKAYANLLYLYHPEANSGESEEFLDVAAEIANMIVYFNAEAEKKVKLGTYGLPDPESHDLPYFEPIKTSRHRYAISKLLARGDNSLVYAARMDGADFDNACLKVAKGLEANERLLVEREVLENVRHYQLPKFIDAFMLKDGLMVLVEELIEGFDLVSLRAMPRYQKGIPQKHMAWIADRGLFTIGELHSLGRMHGNLTPEHLIVKPQSHNVYLVGFGWSVRVPGGHYGFKSDIYGAPEISKEARLDPKSDLYALGKCLIFALGGDPATNQIPKSVNSEIADFLGNLVLGDLELREGDAWDAWYRWSELRLKLFGSRHSCEYFAVD